MYPLGCKEEFNQLVFITLISLLKMVSIRGMWTRKKHFLSKSHLIHVINQRGIGMFGLLNIILFKKDHIHNSTM